MKIDTDTIECKVLSSLKALKVSTVGQLSLYTGVNKLPVFCALVDNPCKARRIPGTTPVKWEYYES